jgi:RNA polymerase sigma-70 factor (ECF subfamily)
MDDSASGRAQAPATFEQVMLPHLDAAYNLARWLLRHEHDAEDCVQEAYLLAFKAFARFRGGDGRAWLLTIVRNTCYSCLRKSVRAEPAVPFDEQLHGAVADTAGRAGFWRREDVREALDRALERLPAEFREVLVLHELEGLAYREIADVAAIPLGTVMSRLSRARARLQSELQQLTQENPPP